MEDGGEAADDYVADLRPVERREQGLEQGHSQIIGRPRLGAPCSSRRTEEGPRARRLVGFEEAGSGVSPQADLALAKAAGSSAHAVREGDGAAVG